MSTLPTANSPDALARLANGNRRAYTALVPRVGPGARGGTRLAFLVAPAVATRFYDRCAAEGRSVAEMFTRLLDAYADATDADDDHNQDPGGWPDDDPGQDPDGACDEYP